MVEVVASFDAVLKGFERHYEDACSVYDAEGQEPLLNAHPKHHREGDKQDKHGEEGEPFAPPSEETKAAPMVFFALLIFVHVLSFLTFPICPLGNRQ